MTMKIAVISTVLGIILSFSTSVSALQILVDLDDGAAAPGGNWNTIASRNLTDLNLIDIFSGLGTGVDLMTSGWEGETPFAGGWTAGPKGWVVPNAAHDLFFTNSLAVPGVLSFSGLGPGNYTVDVVSANSGTTLEDVRVNGAITTQNFDGLAGVSSDNFDEFSEGLNNYLIFNNVTPVAGEITIDFLRLNGNQGSALVQAVRLTSVPEPATLALFGLGIAGLGFSRRKRV